MVSFFGRVSADTVNDDPDLMSISNWPFIRAMNSDSGVPKRCIGSTMDDRRRRVISDMPSSDSVIEPSIGTITMSSLPIAA